MKIKQQKGYPDSSGTVHHLLVDAQKAQSEIDLAKKMTEAGDMSFMEFINKNSSEVLEYIKYNCVKKKPAPKKKAKSASDKK